ncbi:BTB/POZ domain-containing protein KCTD12-like [Pecten maximus]|uniref:BTB/POZ domain-containing protein KCTD12-like n=1 Tax=Pecten maximus TaxID=6579 RepID=UPI001458FDC1|nr:BTB/POZ domain-containing protein KCTD12-like [Pecten maximus]XP_033742028.1 BTB/POZ domain-containing protein KCTD12-like [Pecten maximus]XP_033742029.1 BTB/POZ domain-containing protein KCTD12-like [Pecten maximus]XP_033742030.1 BTB/POZ domain-containing protein KCTD12-like [Pecten maximus]XP_033742031.1 BTB/POZ domain-containing protein KCTD12-like [Pecten maximus]XP_033742032.1 BTB/POZ domain-containing protein KCTD12-like [Pecten maximus]XP_033742034.1 BTB/POZ domain-containing protei
MSENVDNAECEEFPEIVELNVGGVFYTSTLRTLKQESDSLLGQTFNGTAALKLIKDSKGKYFLDRDGVLFRYILDYLRNNKLVLPENFHEKERLKQEAEYFQLPGLVKSLCSLIATAPKVGPMSQSKIPPITNSNSLGSVTSRPGCITVGYRGTFAFGRDGLADVKFRKISRIIVCGKVSLCREVFKDTLNESRDPDRGVSDRYTVRFFLKHNFLEQAFDMLYEEGFSLSSCCASGTNNAGEIKAGMDTEEAKWQHYNEFIFSRK